jgi:hypothetical protein
MGMLRKILEKTVQRHILLWLFPHDLHKYLMAGGE